MVFNLYFNFRLTRECVAIPNHVQIQKLIKVLGTDFALSLNSNMRKGGLIGLAAMAIALGKVKPSLDCHFNFLIILLNHFIN